jgi:hypothetical protein
MKNVFSPSIILSGIMAVTTPINTAAQNIKPDPVYCGVRANELQQNLKNLVLRAQRQSPK